MIKEILLQRVQRDGPKFIILSRRFRYNFKTSQKLAQFLDIQSANIIAINCLNDNNFHRIKKYLIKGKHGLQIKYLIIITHQNMVDFIYQHQPFMEWVKAHKIVLHFYAQPKGSLKELKKQYRVIDIRYGLPWPGYEIIVDGRKIRLKNLNK